MTFATPTREGFPSLTTVTEAAKADRLGTRAEKAVYKGYAYALTTYSDSRLHRWFVDMVERHGHPPHLFDLLNRIDESEVVS